MARRPTARSTSPIPLAELSRWLTPAEVDEACEAAPAVWTPTVEGVRGAWFDAEAVERVIRAAGRLRHTKGRWRHRPFRFDPWQLLWLVAPIFGWKHPRSAEHPAGLRVIRTVWCEICRKNGKSTMCSALGSVLLTADSEPGAEVYAAATSKDEARIVQGAAAQMLASVPELRGRIEVLRDVIRYHPTGGIFRVLSRNPAHGLNVSGAVIDEVHVHPRRDLIDTIETGTAAREQPLVIHITTADAGDDTTIYGEKHNYTISVAQRAISDPSHYGAIWAADPSDDPWDVVTWRKANPALGRTISLDYLEREARRAQTTPTYFPTFARLHLNLRVRAEGRMFTDSAWDRCGGLVSESELRGRECYAGVDLSNVSDFTAYVLLFPPLPDDPDGGRWKAVPRLYLPREALEARPPLRSQLLAWEAARHLSVTDGSMTHYDLIESQISRDAARYRISELAYDPWNAPQLISHLAEGGLVVWPLSQGYAGLNTPTKTLVRMVGDRLLNHGGHPVLRWMALNTVAREDPGGNLRPDKARSSDKIDGLSALVNAVAAATRAHDQSIVVLEGPLMA